MNGTQHEHEHERGIGIHHNIIKDQSKFNA